MSTAQDLEKNQKERYLPTDHTIYAKSNILISAKYRSTLLENKLMAYSLAHADQFDLGQSDRETIKSVMNVSELKKVLGGNEGSFYSQLRMTAEAMTGRNIGLSSPDGRTFDYIAVVTRATCQNGKFTIEYNGAVRNLLLGLRENGHYSLLSLEYQLGFKNNYAFRLYELLRQKCFTPKYAKKEDAKSFVIQFSLSELKLDMGIVNAELDTVRRILNKSTTPDYDKAVAQSPEKMFVRWVDFRRKVLDKAVKEVNELTDLHVEFEPVKHGVGGKVVGVNFMVDLKDASGKKAPLTINEDEKLDILFELRDLTEKRFSSSELRKIAEAANWDREKVSACYQLLLNAKGVSNPVGWLISAIKEGYEASPKQEQIEGHKKTRRVRKNSFTDFEQRDYDFEALEAALLNKD